MFITKNALSLVGLMAVSQLALAGQFLGVSVPMQFGGMAVVAALAVIIGAQLINRKK